MRKIYLIRLFFVFIIFSCLVFTTPSIVFASNNQEAILAGGCFWCLEHDLESLEGINFVQSGYSGGDLKDPTYRNHSGHQEVVLVNFDADKITFESLLRSYWRNIDPFDNKGQFCDQGDPYRPIIFYKNNDQFEDATQSINKVAKELLVSNDKILVDIKPAKTFWIAEDYHQDYSKKNNIKYNLYRYGCGRDKRLEEVWGVNNKSGQNWKNQDKS